MPDSYTEIVQFEWRIDGDKGPEAASAKMNAALDGIDAKITAIGTNAANVFGSSFRASLAPAVDSVNSLNDALKTTFDRLTAIKNVGPMNPFGDRGGAPPPNNPDQPSSGGGDVLGTVGGFTFYKSKPTVRNEIGRYASAEDAFASQAAQVPPPTPSTFSGDMFPATRATGFNITTSPSNYGSSGVGPNQPSFLAGGFSFAPPSEFASGQIGSGNVPDWWKPNRASSTDPQTMGAAALNREMDSLRKKMSDINDALVAAGRGSERPTDLQSMNDPIASNYRLISDRADAIKNEMEARYGPGISPSYSLPVDAPGNRRRWGARKTREQAAQEAVDQQQQDVDTSNWISAQVPSRYSKPTLGNLGVLGENDPRFISESFDVPKNVFGISPAENDRLNAQQTPESQPEWLRNLLNQQPQQSQALETVTLPTEQIKATFGYIQDATPSIVQLGAAFQDIGKYSKPVLTNFGIEGVPVNARGGDQWSNGLANFTNGYSDLQSQANQLSSITDLLQQFSKLRYGGPARDGLLGNEVGFPVETGWTSPIYGQGTVLGGLLNAPQPQVIPGQGSSFGIPGFQTPPQQTIDPNSQNYTYATGTGTRFDFPPGGYSSGGYYGYAAQQNSYQYTPPPPPGSSATYGPGGYGSPGSPFSFGSGTVFPGAGNPNGFGMAGGLWGGGGANGPPGPPFVPGGWQQGNQTPNFNPNTLNYAGQVNNVGVEFENATNKAGNFERALQRIVTYSVIFAGFAAVGAAIKGVADEMVRLSDVQARIGFINGQSIQRTEQQFTQSASYGISPAQAGQGILTAGQLGASPQQNQQAQQLAMIFGADQYSSSLIQLSRTQEQASATGLKYVNTLDFIAQSTKSYAGGTLNDYFAALQHGIQLNAQFGVSAEGMGLAIEKASVATGQSPDQISVAYQSILSKVATPATQKALEPLGIQRGDTTTMVREIATEYERLAAAGDRSGIQKLGEALQGGGIGGYSRIETLPSIFQALSGALDEVSPRMAKFSDLLTSASNSDVTKINKLTAAWNNFLLALGTGIPGSAIGNFLDATTSKLNNLTNISEHGGQAIGNIASDPGDAISRMAKYQGDHPFNFINLLQSIPGPFPGSNPDKILEQISGLINAANGGGIGGSNEGGRPGQFPIGSNGVVSSGPGLRVPQSVLNPYPNPLENFGGLQTMPQQVGFDQYQKMIQQQETQLKIAGVPIDDKNYEVLSHSGQLLGQMLVDSNAIRLTNEKIAQNTSTFGGTAPTGVTASNAADFQAKVTAEDAKLKAAGITVSDPKTVVFQDKSTDALFSIRGSNEAIQFETAKIAANTASFSGVLPKGEDLAKIQARVSAIDSSGMVGKAGLDTTDVQKVFWDPVTQTLKSIHGTETAIQIATEEAAKLLQQQITGTFNVPAGGEAVVAFFALQQGFIPGGAGGPGGAGAGGSATALTGSAGALSGSAYQLNSAAAALISAANAIGGPNGDILREIAAHESNTYTTGTGNQSIANYIQAHQGSGSGSGLGGPGSYDRGADRSQPVYHDALPQSNIHGQFERGGVRTGPGISDDDKLYAQLHEKFKGMIDTLIGRYPLGNVTQRERVPSGAIGSSGRSAGSSPTNVNVANAIRINIDGRQIAYYMNRKTYRQFESVRNSVSGVPNSVVTL